MKEHLLPSIRLYLALTLLLGFAYPLLVWAVGQAAFREKANGSFLRMKDSSGASSDRVVGSALIGQSFHSRRFFDSRPSAAGDAGYDATASGGANLGPTSRKLAEAVRAAVSRVREENPPAAGPVPADAVTSSGSGLDPDISPEYARLQIPRVARETRIPASDLEALVAARTEPRFLGVWGERRVNVLLLNLDVERRLRERDRAAR
jgi:K+-transporting ATPase ATPase C chain